MQPLPSLQVNVPEVTQLPDEQWSPVVHALPSLHGFVLSLVCVHASVASLHASSVQALVSAQERAAPVQAPDEQTSFTVQYRPSSHGAVLLAWRQPTSESHESVVHGLSSSQSSADAPTQLPPEQVSTVVQGF